MSGGVEASGGIQASHGVAKSAPTTPPIRCRPSTPGPVQWQTRCEEVPSMNGDLHVPDAHTRDEAQAAAPDQRDVGMWGCKSVHDQQMSMLGCGDVRALTAGRLRTPSWGQHFEIRGSGPQAVVHSCIVSHVVDLRALYGDIAAADVLASSLRCLHLFESELGLTDSRGTVWMYVRGDRVASQVKAAAILGLAAKMVVNADCEVPVAHLWTRVAAGTANIALVKAFEIQLLNQWPGLVL